MKGVVLFLMLCAFHISAYGQDKSNAKTISMLINIAYQDLYGKSIRLTDESFLEKSILAVGDKELCSADIINGLINQAKSNTPVILNCDSACFDKFRDCPRIAAYRGIDPVLMVAGLMAYRISTADTNLYKSFMLYSSWQDKFAKHSPMANNDREDLTGDEAMKWLMSYTETWLEQYHDEYKLILIQFDSCYKIWHANHKGSYADFVLYYSKKVQHGLDIGVSQALDVSPSGAVRSGVNIITLPAEDKMRNDTRNFINEAYENLYIRVPTPEEMSILEEFIAQHPSLTVKQFYYSMMTSKEYNYY